MTTCRTEVAAIVIFIVVIVGTVVFFLFRMEQDSQAGRVDLHELVLPESKGVLRINKPDMFVSMLERQPQLKQHFKELIPDDYFKLLDHIKYSPVLLAYYPQGIVMLYQLQNIHDKASQCFRPDQAFRIKKAGREFVFLPRASTRYFGYYQSGGVCVASYSRKLLESVAGLNSGGEGQGDFFLKKEISKYDRSALLNATCRVGERREWQSLDVFMHENQLCCLLNEPYMQDSDSIMASVTDSLSSRIAALIPGIEIQSDYRVMDSVIYFTFCTSLLSSVPKE